VAVALYGGAQRGVALHGVTLRDGVMLHGVVVQNTR
jgi:hypothetical protein